MKWEGWVGGCEARAAAAAEAAVVPEDCRADNVEAA